MSWEQYLSDMETKIASAELLLDEEADFGPELLLPFEPPSNLGPFPSDLRERALDVLQKNSELEMRMRNVMETVGRQLSATTRATSAQRRSSAFAETAAPQYFDRRG